MVRESAWPTASKTFRSKRDAADWSRRTEDEMVRGVCSDPANGGSGLDIGRSV